MKLFEPKQILDIYTDLDIEGMKKAGFEMALLDVDNTIAVPNTGTCDERAEKFIKDLQKAGFKVVIFSNNNRKRVEMFIRGMKVNYHYLALKPLPFSFRHVCHKYGVSPEKTIVLGDQLLTDMLGANLSGCYGIYCRQLQEKDSALTAFNRKIENKIWRHIRHEEM